MGFQYSPLMVIRWSSVAMLKYQIATYMFFANNARQPKTNMGLSACPICFRGNKTHHPVWFVAMIHIFLDVLGGKHVIFRDTQISYICKTYPKLWVLSPLSSPLNQYNMVIAPRIFHGISLRNETAMVPTSGSSRTGRIGMVLLNASLMARWYTASVSGFEYKIGGVYHVITVIY